MCKFRISAFMATTALIFCFCLTALGQPPAPSPTPSPSGTAVGALPAPGPSPIPAAGGAGGTAKGGHRVAASSTYSNQVLLYGSCSDGPIVEDGRGTSFANRSNTAVRSEVWRGKKLVGVWWRLLPKNTSVAHVVVSNGGCGSIPTTIEKDPEYIVGFIFAYKKTVCRVLVDSKDESGPLATLVLKEGVRRDSIYVESEAEAEEGNGQLRTALEQLTRVHKDIVLARNAQDAGYTIQLHGVGYKNVNEKFTFDEYPVLQEFLKTRELWAPGTTTSAAAAAAIMTTKP
jgi:hypothetical protein